ncbi:MAG: DinB family protein [Anaerolineae bacterium]
MGADESVRSELLFLLRGGNAHEGLEEVAAGIPAKHRNRRAPGLGYTPWQLLEHIRIAQWDIVQFVQDPAYVSPPWPEGYWPPKDAEADDDAWQVTLRAIRTDRQELEDLVEDPTTDLYTPLAHGTGQNVLREVLVVSDHMAYHLGELGLLRSVLAK